MSSPTHNIFDSEEYRYDHNPNTWVYVETDSSPSPPVYNADNCSHEGLGGYTNGLPQPTTTQLYQHALNSATFHQPPESYPSSTTSGLGPEGLEHEHPNLHLTTSYLPLCPDPGLNESQHRRSAAFHSSPPYALQRYLSEQQEHQPLRHIAPPPLPPYHPSPYSAQAQNGFLTQDTHIRSPMKLKHKKDARRGKRSYQSGTSVSSEDYAFVIGADAMAHVGRWAQDERGECGGEDYALTLSGTTDELSGE